MPGFVDTHRHTWQTALRGICADWTLTDYFLGHPLDALAALHAPTTSTRATYAGALEALDAGVTTILDFSHCNNTPEHADAARRTASTTRASAPCSPTATTRRRAREPAFAAHAAAARRRAPRRRARSPSATRCHHGRLAHRGRAAPVRGHGRRGRLGARARRPDRRAHRLHVGLADQRWASTEFARAAACSAPTRSTCTATPVRGRLDAARARRVQGLVQPGDRVPDGHGPPGRSTARWQHGMRPSA